MFLALTRKRSANGNKQFSHLSDDSASSLWEQVAVKASFVAEKLKGFASVAFPYDFPPRVSVWLVQSCLEHKYKLKFFTNC